jgi:hypothetical protein
MLKKFVKFFNDWGHFGFLGFALLYFKTGEMDMFYMMLMLFFLEEISLERYDVK